MVIFHDEAGNVVGSYESTPELEGLVGIQSNATKKITVPEELAQRFSDPTDDAHPFNHVVENDQIIPKQSDEA